ncbi:hypothetical protein K458DRAFT_429820 [Lentithecium fluviatile CBS 122367]|uniref:Rax2-like C-terminal domain-containing protein n=1 Tax=Lentithecium fluviatile CBS 122367 TaxID=1168545 RepID=A0A6G1J8M6_9PLEO|nr:hypothetical protein K458DRAFT_429820 [Lentithecium fluviatile CBS 122367]
MAASTSMCHPLQKTRMAICLLWNLLFSNLLTSIPWVMGDPLVASTSFALASHLTGNQSTISIPVLDLNGFGRVAFTGDFDALMTYGYQNSTTTVGTMLTQSIRAQLPDGTFAVLATADADIKHMCVVPVLGSGYFVIVAGNFTSIDDVHAPAIAAFDPSAKAGEAITALAGLNGSVNALLCDDKSSTAYVGGYLGAANSTNALMWIKHEGWNELPFHGFNGPINSIVKAPSGNIVFGGSFTGFGGTEFANRTLNGLFEYDPTQEPFNASLSSPIADVGLALDPGAIINDMVLFGDTIAVMGNFSGANTSNILFIHGNGSSSALTGGGLNGPVLSAYYLEDQNAILVGGNFSDTVDGYLGDLANVARYSIENKLWSPLRAGINGTVNSFNKLTFNISIDEPEDIIIINGHFGKLHALGNDPAITVRDIGVWVPSKDNWLSNLDVLDKPKFEGILSTSVDLPDEQGRLFAGSISSWILSATGIISIDYDATSRKTVLGSLGLELTAQGSDESGNGVAAGLFYTQDGLNITVVGGSFTVDSRTGSTIHNLAFINGTDPQKVRIDGLRRLTSAWHIQCLEVTGHILFAGGTFEQTVNDQKMNGLLVFDLLQNTYTDPQPLALGGNSVDVRAIRTRPMTRQVFVAGTFGTAGGLNCSTVCVYDMNTRAWTRPGSNLGGSASHMTWTTRDTLIVAGNITIDNKPLILAAYNAPADQWTPFNELHPLDGVVTAMIPADSSASGSLWSSDSAGFWVAGKTNNGSAFLKKWDGAAWHTVEQGFDPTSIIHGLKILRTATRGSENEFLQADQVLLVFGKLNLTDQIPSAALFDGTTFLPYIFTKTADDDIGVLTSMFSTYDSYFYSVGDADQKGHVVAIAVTVLVVLVSILAIGEVENKWRIWRLKGSSR